MTTWLLIRRLRGPAFLILFGITAMLNQWGVLGFGRSWPLYLILAGLLGLAERAALAGRTPVLNPGWYRRPNRMPLPRPNRIPPLPPLPSTRSLIPTGGPDGHPASALFPTGRSPRATLLPAIPSASLHCRPVSADHCGSHRPAGRNQSTESGSPVGLVHALVASVAGGGGFALAGRLVAGPQACGHRPALAWRVARGTDCADYLSCGGGLCGRRHQPWTARHARVRSRRGARGYVFPPVGTGAQ